jgi:GNAT superfamily N-acetyltransferase
MSRPALVRPADGGDVEAVVGMITDFKLLSQSVSPVYDALRPGAGETLRQLVETAISDAARVCLVASVEGERCGFLIGAEKPYAPIYAIERLGYVSDLFVKAPFRRQGVGAALLGGAEAAFRQRGIAHMCLESIVHYPANTAFYERCGYDVFIRQFRKTL